MDIKPYTLRWWMMMYQIALSRQLAYYEKGNDEQFSRYLKLCDCIEFRIVEKYGEPDGCGVCGDVDYPKCPCGGCCELCCECE